jgi:hypothetical protein
MSAQPLFLVRVHANAVGAGIGIAINAMQKAKVKDTAESWVQFCIKAAAEAYAAVIEDPPEAPLGSVGKFMLASSLAQDIPVPTEQLTGKPLEAIAHEAAQTAFRACMPHLTGRRNAQAYIACVAAGVQLKYITGSESRSLMYSAQLALAAARPSRAR